LTSCVLSKAGLELPLERLRAVGRRPQDTTGTTRSGPSWTMAGYDCTMVGIELERVEALELLGMTLAHLNDAEARGELSPRVPLLMAVRDKLARALREEL
jgi:hypothetical protein